MAKFEEHFHNFQLERLAKPSESRFAPYLELQDALHV